MGEAKRRAERRREARSAGVPEPVYAPGTPRLRQRLTSFLPDVYTELEAERAAFNEERGQTFDFDAYLNGLVTSACEHERQARAQRKATEAARENLVQPATAGQVQKILAKMAPAVPRPAA